VRHCGGAGGKCHLVKIRERLAGQVIVYMAHKVCKVAQTLQRGRGRQCHVVAGIAQMHRRVHP
jgi:hypothetical protein